MRQRIEGMFHPVQRFEDDGPVVALGESQVDPLLDVLGHLRGTRVDAVAA